MAFRFEGVWHQIPVQVDERAVINFTDVYNGRTTYGSFSRLDYTDAGTFTGPDPDSSLDADDEVVFMAGDAGARCLAAVPPPDGVVRDRGVEVQITDPLGGAPEYVYLFRQTGGLDPGAGAQYVHYTFNLLSGDYKTTYKIGAGPNPENSTVSTAAYSRHFSDRWVCDGLSVFSGGATGADILDRHKNLFAPGYCGRSEKTFSAGEGAFIINKSGPVRAIRSYVGANSGPRTQRRHVYYAEREEITTFLRVHSIPMVGDYFDYGPAALGMTYANDLNPGGVTIDGVPDAVTPGCVRWELVAGPQGAAAMLFDSRADFTPFSCTNYYNDEEVPSVTQCTGDTHEYGASGMWVNCAIPNTDPNKGPAALLELKRTIYYLPPEAAVLDAELCRSYVDFPPEAVCREWSSPVVAELPAAGPCGMAGLALLLGLTGAAGLAFRACPRAGERR